MHKKAQRIIVFIESDSLSIDTPDKIATLTINRFAIDEDAAFDILSIYYAPFVTEKAETLSTDLNKTIESATRKIHSLKFSESDMSGLRLIFALDEYQNSFSCSLKTTMLDDFPSITHQRYSWTSLLKIFKMQSVMVTFLTMRRHRLITKEQMEAYPEGREKLKQSVSDDLDDFVWKLRLGETIKPRSRTYYLPKLTEKEKNLVECRDTGFMYTILQSYPDKILQNMKTSESNSMYLYGECLRQTFHRKQNHNIL